MTREPTAAIHITGASGCGVTTLGRAVASALGALHVDADDVFWLPTDPPYTQKRERGARLQMLNKSFLSAGARGWVLSGSILDWGDSLIPLFCQVIFLSASLALRLERLKARESQRYGARIDPGGDMYSAHREFLEWSAAYDSGASGRTRARHEEWLLRVEAPILRLDGANTTGDLVTRVLKQVRQVT